MNHPWGPKIFPPVTDESPWQKSVAGNPLLHHNRDVGLPTEADVVVIGSGLSGSMTSYHLLSSPNRPRKVVCLEARHISSGATGRNGGNCRPDAFRGFAAYAKIHGVEEARKIIKSERTVLGLVESFIKEHGVDCDFFPFTTYDAIMTEEFESYVDASFQEAKAAGVDMSWISRLGKDDAQKVCAKSRGAYTWRAATLNPLKLVLAIQRINMELGGYDLFSWAPVTSVAPGKQRKWSVHTSRGNIETDKVVYATNAYTKLILPEMEGLIKPWTISAVSLTAPQEKLTGGVSCRFTLDSFYYVAPRADGTLVAGTSPDLRRPEDLGLKENMDDSTGDEEVAQSIHHTMAWAFPNLGYDAKKGVGKEYSWGGVIAMTPDRVPWVGAVPGKDGQYMIAGMGAHGMARIFHCAPSLASIMLDGPWDPELPSVFRVTSERVQAWKPVERIQDELQGRLVFCKL